MHLPRFALSRCAADATVDMTGATACRVILIEACSTEIGHGADGYEQFRFSCLIRDSASPGRSLADRALHDAAALALT